MDILDLLSNSDAIKGGLNLEMDADPIVSLFSYEFARYKPAAPPSPLLQPKPKSGKKKRDRKAEYEKAKAKKAAISTDPVDSGEQCA